LSRKRWHVAVVTGTEIAAGYVCAFAALGPAMIVQGCLVERPMMARARPNKRLKLAGAHK